MIFFVLAAKKNHACMFQKTKKVTQVQFQMKIDNPNYDQTRLTSGFIFILKKVGNDCSISMSFDAEILNMVGLKDI